MVVDFVALAVGVAGEEEDEECVPVVVLVVLLLEGVSIILVFFKGGCLFVWLVEGDEISKKSNI